MKACVLLLTCANEKEAKLVSETLLSKKLVVCIKSFPVSSSFLWQGKINSSDEIMLVMDSVEEKFGRVEEEVAKIHSYDTPTLVALPVTQTTQKVKEWIEKELV